MSRLFVETRGEGKPIVLLHGGASSHRYWYELVNHLPGYQLVMPDLLGLGDSPKPRSLNYTAEDHVLALKHLLESEKVEQPFTLIGHSIGALVAAAYATAYPEHIKRLILVSPPLYKNAAEARKMIVEAVNVPNWIIWGPSAALICNTICRVPSLYLWLARQMTPKRVPDWMVEDSAKHTWTSYSRTMREVVFKQDVLSKLKKFTGPLIVVWGAQDASIVPGNLGELGDLPSVTLIKLETGHDIPILQAEQLAQIIQKDAR